MRHQHKPTDQATYQPKRKPTAFDFVFHLCSHRQSAVTHTHTLGDWLAALLILPTVLLLPCVYRLQEVWLEEGETTLHRGRLGRCEEKGLASLCVEPLLELC